MEIKQQLRAAIAIVLAFAVVTGIAFPLAMTGVGQAAFNNKADGSLIRNPQGEVIGSELIGQNFSTPQYFHPRPSAAGEDGYDAMASAASNLGPSNPQLTTLIQQRAERYRQENGLRPDYAVPVDAVTASASGLDPHISPANAYLQVGRVAQARGMDQNMVNDLVKAYVEDKTLGFLGEPRVNVLMLNLALDKLSPS